MTHKTSADAIVIGAGVIGSGVALELARAGRDVICVDRLAGAGFGSTSSSSSVIRYTYSTAAGVAMAWEGVHIWKDWANHLRLPEGTPLAEFKQTGMLTIFSEGVDEALFLPRYHEVGIPHEVLTGEQIEERFPAIDAGRYGPPTRLDDDAFWADATSKLPSACFDSEAGFINDPMLAAQNLAQAAEAAGATFRYSTEITGIRHDDSRVSGVDLTDGSTIDAPVIVNVAGPHSHAINSMAGIAGSMNVVPKPMRREVFIAPAPPGSNWDDDGIMFGDIDFGTYTRPERGDNVLIGGVEPDCDPLEWIDDPDEADEVVDTNEFELHVLRAARRLPGMGVPPHKRGVVGVYDASPDWTPIYDRSDLDGFYMAIGTSGNQFKNAPIAGRCMAALIAAVEDGHDHDADPVVVTGQHTGLEIDLGTFSRNRSLDGGGPTNVLG